MDRDPGVQLVSAARSPRTAPDPDALWHRGRQRRRRRRAASVFTVASIVVLVAVVVVQWTGRVPRGPVVSDAVGDVLLTGIDQLVGSGGVVWAVQDGVLVKAAPGGPVAWDDPSRACDLRSGAQGWAVVSSCDTGVTTLVRPDLSTVRWDGEGKPMAAGSQPDGSTWVVVESGEFVTWTDAGNRQSVDVGGTPTAVTAADGVVWVAVAASGRGSLVRIENSMVTYRVPLSAEPTATVATTDAVWVLTHQGVVQVDPASNREAAGPTLPDGADGLAGANIAWTWASGTAKQLGGVAEVAIPAGVTQVAAADDALFVLVSGDVVRVTPSTG